MLSKVSVCGWRSGKKSRLTRKAYCRIPLAASDPCKESMLNICVSIYIISELFCSPKQKPNILSPDSSNVRILPLLMH